MKITHAYLFQLLQANDRIIRFWSVSKIGLISNPNRKAAHFPSKWVAIDFQGGHLRLGKIKINGRTASQFSPKNTFTGHLSKMYTCLKPELFQATSLNYFRLSFRNCKSCVYNCDDLLSFKKKFPFWPYNLESFYIDQVSSIKMPRLASSFFQYVKDLQVINAESNLDKIKTSWPKKLSQ